jgi:hypothetical protein
MNSTIRLKAAYILTIGILSLMSSASNAQKDELKTLLERPYNLQPKYIVGDKDYYHMKTIYRTMNDSGRVANTQVLDGYYCREVIRIEKDERFDRFEWKYVKKGQSLRRSKVTHFKIMPYTQKFRYDMSDKEWERHHFPIDFSSIPKTMEGWNFVVKLFDAHTFDVLMKRHGFEEKLTHIGDKAFQPADDTPIAMDFPPLFTDTYFTSARVDITFQGLTSFNNEPCAILLFQSDDNSVRMVVNMMDMKLPTEGVSYYWGQMFVSLATGRLVSAYLLERVDSITHAFGGTTGKPMKQVVLREITIESMDKSEYEGSE